MKDEKIVESLPSYAQLADTMYEDQGDVRVLVWVMEQQAALDNALRPTWDMVTQAREEGQREGFREGYATRDFELRERMGFLTPEEELYGAP